MFNLNLWLKVTGAKHAVGLAGVHAVLMLAGALILSVGLAVSAAASPGVIAADDDAREWNFKVYLNDSEIGYHNFRLIETKSQQQVMTEADFKVKFLFITAYEYKHVNTETWAENCLQSIESQTDANGKEFAVRGVQAPDGFEVQASDRKNALSGCVMSFAYWNPDFLQADALLNSQTGEYLPVRVEAAGEETLVVRGQETLAKRYRLIAEDMNLDIWYSKDGRWLGLQSTLENGRKLRYELV